MWKQTYAYIYVYVHIYYLKGISENTNFIVESFDLVTYNSQGVYFFYLTKFDTQQTKPL